MLILCHDNVHILKFICFAGELVIFGKVELIF